MDNVVTEIVKEGVYFLCSEDEEYLDLLFKRAKVEVKGEDNGKA